jgi:hypothetical protein
MVGFGITKFTRAREPALLWNQLRSEPPRERYGDFATATLVAGSSAIGVGLRYKSALWIRANPQVASPVVPDAGDRIS